MNEENFLSRRMFIEKSLAGMAALSVPWYLNCGKPGPEISLFFSSEDIPRIRETVRHPLFKDYWASLVNINFEDEINFLNNELDYNNHVRHLARAFNTLKYSSLVTLIDENKEHEQLAKLAIEKILQFNEWDFFLEDGKDVIGLQRASETTISMSLAYEFLSDRLSSSEKEQMLDGIAKKGVPACFRTLYGMQNPDTVKGWALNPTTTYKSTVSLKRWPYFLNGTNLKAIPIAGLTVGAAMFYGKNPEAEKWMTLARQSLEKFTSDLYGKDGCYPEGVGYWAYATHHIIMAADVIKRKLGKDYSKVIDFKGTIRYGLQMQMPSDNKVADVVNFGDAGNRTNISLGYWIAREFKDGIAQYTAETFADRKNIFALIWYDGSVKAEKPGEELYETKFSHDRIVSRTGWGNNDTVVAFRSGGPGNHEHADRNSIILKAYGERLFNDPFKASYHTHQKHWLLRLTEAHTAALVDGKGHQYHDGSEGTNSSLAESRVVQYETNGRLKVFTSDATHAYNLVNGDISKVQRTLVFLKPDILVIVDELKKNKYSSRLQARFQAYDHDKKAALAVSGKNNTFRIKRPGAELYAKVAGNTRIKVKKDKLDIPEDIGSYPFIEISSGKSRNIHMVTACAIKNAESGVTPEISVKKVNGGYEISARTEKTSTGIRIKLDTDYPKASLILN